VAVVVVESGDDAEPGITHILARKSTTASSSRIGPIAAKITVVTTTNDRARGVELDRRRLTPSVNSNMIHDAVCRVYNSYTHPAKLQRPTSRSRSFGHLSRRCPGEPVSARGEPCRRASMEHAQR
jgi:hypothetical protein